MAGSLAGFVLAPQVAAVLPVTGSHGPWFASRAAGIAAYLMAWIAMLSGILGSTGAMDGWVNRARLMAIHQSASLTAVGLAAFHAFMLLFDTWAGFGPLEIVVPFAGAYEPAKVAAGIGSFYLFALVTASFWFRRAIGMRTWRMIHLGSMVAFAGALWHGLALGRDTGQAWMFATYVLTSATIVGALVQRTVIAPPGARKARGAKSG
jgi:predicted ferric reductase